MLASAPASEIREPRRWISVLVTVAAFYRCNIEISLLLRDRGPENGLYLSGSGNCNVEDTRTAYSYFLTAVAVALYVPDHMRLNVCIIPICSAVIYCV